MKEWVLQEVERGKVGEELFWGRVPGENLAQQVGADAQHCRKGRERRERSGKADLGTARGGFACRAGIPGMSGAPKQA